MHKSLFSFFALVTACQALPSSAHRRSTGDLVAATWYAGWHSAEFTPADISWNKYTHITYSFAETTDSVTEISLSGSGTSQGLHDFVKTAKANSVHPLISIGGWTGSRFFSSNVGNAKNRTLFVKTVTDFVLKYGLEGIDFDWEYPARQGIGCNVVSAHDSANFLAFLQELRASSVGSNLILTAAASITPWVGADVAKFANVLDYVAIMNYDVWGSWSPTVGPNAPLNDTCAPAAQRAGSAVSAVKAWTAAGMPLHKIVLGVAAYGHAFHVSHQSALASDSTATSIYDLNLYPKFESPTPRGDAWDDQPGPDVCGVVSTSYSGIYNFWGLIKAGFLNENGNLADGIHYKWDDCSQTPFVYNKTSEVMVSFDSSNSFESKGIYIKNTGLRGFAMWEAAGDYHDILLNAIRSTAGF